jgi:predicted porin
LCAKIESARAKNAQQSANQVRGCCGETAVSAVNTTKLKKGFSNIKLIAAAVAAATALDASAAQIYSKDDTTLDVTGYVDAVYFSGHNNKVPGAENDATIGNRTRFGLKGRTKIANGIYGIGRFEHQWQNNGDSTNNNETSRDQWAGVDFTKFGVLKAGRYLNNEYKIEAVTDVFERLGGYGESYATRNSGKINYEISYAGFSAALEYQTATNNYTFAEGETDVDHGFSAVLGYKSPAVLFGPIGVQLSAGYLKFQDDDVTTTRSVSDSYIGNVNVGAILAALDHENSFGGSLTWGTYGNGLYLASWYQQIKGEAYDDYRYDDLTIKNSESVVAYSFDNGVTLQAAYQWKDLDVRDSEGNNTIVRKVPLMVAWNLNPNFRVWADDVIDAGSSDDVSDDNVFSVGARFVF